MTSNKDILSKKAQVGHGGIDCPCCRKGSSNKKDMKLWAARSTRRIVRQTIRLEEVEEAQE